jgi:hypothetical protein
MTRTTSRALAGALLLAAACGDATEPNATASGDLLANALTTVSPGFTTLSSSFSSSATDAAWVPGPGGPGRGALGMAGLLGGGLAPEFSGALTLGAGGFGPGRGHGPALPTCTGTYNASTGRVTCAAVTQNGLTINRSFAYTDASGKAQSAFDSLTTNTVNEKVDVSGTTTFTADTARMGRDHHGPGGPGFFGFGRGSDSSHVTVLTATSTVKHSSDRTTSGLAPSSTQRTVNSTASGTESTTGTTSAGTFTATRATGDTTKGLVIPKATSTNTHPYPTAGTVIRAMSATVTLQGQAAQSTTRREVITYDGSATAKLTITQDGTTKSCTIALPHGRPSCS